MCALRRLRSARASALSDQFLLCAQRVVKDPSFLHADIEDPDQSGQMPRLIWVFAGHISTLLVLSWCSSFADRNSDYWAYFKGLIVQQKKTSRICREKTDEAAHALPSWNISDKCTTWRIWGCIIINNWAWQNQQNDLCAQLKPRSAWASAQSDQSLCCAFYG